MSIAQMETIAPSPGCDALARLAAGAILPGGRPLIVGAYGMENIGDEAILAGLLTRLPPGTRPIVVSGAPAATTALHGIEAVGPGGVLSALYRCDAVVIGGGGLFTSHVGTLARTIPVFGLVAAAMQKPVYIAGVSIDSSTPAFLRPVARALFARARTVSVRDPASARLLERWGVCSAIAPDLSYHVRPAGRERAQEVLRQAGLDAHRPTVALCLTAVEPRLDAPLSAAIPSLVAAFPELQFCMVPMSRHRARLRHNDLVQARRLQRLAPRLAVAEASAPAEVIALIRECVAAVCMRYHSLLFADRSGVPIVGVPYAEKCRNWMEERGAVPTRCEPGALRRALEDALERKESEVRAAAG